MAAVIAAPLVGLGLSSTAATTIATLGLYAATTAASIFLQMAMAEKPEEEIGTKLNAVLGGAVNQSFHIGDKESAGSFLYKGSWGKSGRVPNAYLVKVYCLSDRPVNGFADYLWVDGIKCNYDPEETTTIDGVGVGHPIPKYDQGGGHRLWVKFHDGNQSNADNYLVAKFGTGPRAWTEDFVGRGRAYMIVTQKYDKKNPSGEVEVLPVIKNSRLYDFRNDSTNGGSGAQRYNDDSTWGVDPGNPVTASYHIMRGLYRGNEWIFGGQKWPATRFDIATWTAAANKCDSDIAAGGGGTLKFSRVGAEIDVSEEPWTIIERMLKSCNGRLVESGGKFKIYAGGIGASVYSFTDDQVILSEELTGRVFPTRDDIANTVVGTYIEPSNAGEAKAYKARTKTAYVEADGDVRKMTFDLDYVRDNRQAQRLAQLALNDNRRFRTFVVAFWSQARMLEPCDVISWTSDRFQFTNKKFIVGDVVLRDDGVVVANLREADATDADWNPITDENPFETGVFEDLDEPTQTLTATVTAVVQEDDDGKHRRPAINIVATVDDDFVDCEALRYVVRKKNGNQKVIYRGRSEGFFDPDSPDYADITFTDNSFLEGRQVQVKYKIDPESDRDTEWSGWVDITLPYILPDTPSNFALTSLSKLGKDGKLDFFAKATWDNVPHDRAGYGLKIEIDGDEDYRKSDDNKYKFPVPAPSTVKAKVRTRGIDNGRAGAYTSELTISVTKKSTAPTTPTFLDVKRQHRRVVVVTEEHPDDDFRRWNVYYSKTNDFTTGTKTQHGRSRRFPLDDLDNHETYYAWITAEDTSGNESAKYPSSNTAGVQFKTKAIEDDDTSNDLNTAPTGLTVTKVQDKDQDGTIRTYLELDCTYPGWAGDKADAVYEITVAGVSKKFKEIGDNGKAARFRVNKTGVLHTVRARIKAGVGELSNWTSGVGITPSKKGSDADAVTGISISRKNGAMIIKWNRISDPDNREVAIYRGTTNVFATMTEIGRTKGTRWRDDDNITKGTRYYYRVLPVDTSDNVGTETASVDDVETGVDDTDTDDTTLAAPSALSLTKVQDKDEDGTIRTYIKLNCTAPAWATTKTTYVYSVTVGSDEYTIKSDDTKARFRVNKTGVLHTVKVRGIKGVGTKGSWSSTTGITPSKKAADASAVTGVTSHKKNGNNIVKWDATTDPDNREFIVKRATVNSYGSATEIGRTKATRFVDSDINAKGTTYYYFIDPIDTSGNIGASSASTNQTEGGIRTSDTDASSLAAPTGISLTQANRDVDQDGTIDIALRTTFSGGVALAAGYEVWWEDSAGQSATVRADSGSFWFVANTTRSYRVRWRTVNWVGTAGAWSSYVGPVTPSPVSGAPAAPVAFFAFDAVGRIGFSWNEPTELDYFYSEIAINGASDSYVRHTTTARFGEFTTSLSGSMTVYARHVNTSGLKSTWSSFSVNVSVPVKMATSLLGGSGGSVNAGLGDITYLAVTFLAASNTTGITINLGSRTWNNVVFVNNEPHTYTTTEIGGGSFSFSKSGGGSFSGVTLSAITVDQ